MTRTRGFQISSSGPNFGPSAGEKASDTSPTDERMGGLLLVIAVSWILFSGGVGYWLWATGHHDKAITAWIVTFTLFVTVMGLWRLWEKRRYASIHWTLLNHQLPLVFVLLPPIAGVLILNVTPPDQICSPQEITGGADAQAVGGSAADPETVKVRDAGDYSTPLVSHVFYPTYYSLLVVVSTIFFNLQTEVEEWMKTLEKGDREASRWHSVSAFCLLIGLFAALLYALPYIADIQGLIEDSIHRATLFYIALAAALFLPLIAILIRAKLERAQTKATGKTKPTEETIYAY
ncbi:hypothetical protein [Candidatus Thiosymbion oneisti]|uniref:hypothetical protein n=1 Tax=Candidatus Thiosymbion oneisti TaxID=589554 RepID=UPI000B7CF2FF|nr:hypothetical protein [Candidatus Thiosymbion oneisti]